MTITPILEMKEKKGNMKDVELIKKISPVAWNHINFLGNYQFRRKSPINIQEMIDEIKNIPITTSLIL